MDSCTIRKSAKVKPSRDFDVLYDPTLFLPTKKDYTREVDRAATMAMTFIVRPRYDTMFSDTHPRQELISKKPDLQIDSLDTKQPKFLGKSVEVKGANRSLFFHQPLPKPRPSTASTLPPLPESLMAQRHLKSDTPQSLTKATQTDFRESETQTVPWSHDVVAHQGAQLLHLNWFTVGRNVPTGLEEISRIQRDFDKQAWDEVLARMRCVDFEQWALMTEALITNETAARESNLDAVNALRMRLAARNLNNTQLDNSEDLKGRLQRFLYFCDANSCEKFRYMKHQLCRGLRKLNMKQRKIERKYKKRDILTELRDKASEIYAPQIRFGENPSRRHQVIDTHCNYLKKYNGFEVLEKRVTQSAHRSRGFDVDKASKATQWGLCIKRKENLIIDDVCDPNSFDVNGVSGDAKKFEAKEHLPVLLGSREMVVQTPGENDTPEWDLHEKLSSIILKATIEGRTVQTEAEKLSEKLKRL